jgi:putative component of toxin-antitoxin plasmid stabilization module
VGVQIVLLLIGGDKSSQSRDIRKAKQLNIEYRDAIRTAGGEE